MSATRTLDANHHIIEGDRVHSNRYRDGHIGKKHQVASMIAGLAGNQNPLRNTKCLILTCIIMKKVIKS